MSNCKFLGIFFALILTACSKSPEPTNEPAPAKKTATPAPYQEVPTASTTGATVIVADTPANLPPPPVEVQQLDVPVYIEGTPALLHPIVTVVQDSKGSVATKMASSDKTDAKAYPSEYQSAYFSKTGLFDYQTNIDNVVFENIETSKAQHVFNQNTYKIQRVFFPYIAEDNRYFANNKTYVPKRQPNETASQNTATKSASSVANTAVNQKFLSDLITVDGVKYKPLPRVLFEVNENPKADSRSKMALYMSDNFGQGITKLHPSNQFLISNEWVEPLQRFYFITQSDSDNNGVINDKDTTYHYYVDFTPSMPVIHSYRYWINKVIYLMHDIDL